MSKVETKSIGELFSNKYTFHIPAYQRGYRWDDEQVRELLEDIFKFNINETKNIENLTQTEIDDNQKKIIPNDTERYCLQPLVVVKKNENEFEVIDGQQRLTTLYLIAITAKEYSYRHSLDGLYSLEYESRNKTKEFIDNLTKADNKPKDDNQPEDIDSYYINNAFNVITRWFNKIDKYKAKEYWYDHFKNNFKNRVNIIWYEVEEDNPIAVFRRLNTGKIKLEDAELIKALLLQSSHNSGEDNGYSEKRKFRIASEWDNIEKELQNNSFWHFLSTDKERKDNRIELIFDIIREKDEEYNPDGKRHKNYNYFLHKITEENPDEAREEVSGKESIQEKIWEEEVIRIFYTLKGWYDNKILYHLIGFLINADNTKCDIIKIYKEIYKESIDNADFIKRLKKKIYELCLTDNGKKIDLENVKYNPNDEKDCKYKDKIKNILLLHNIVTIIDNENSPYKFPFDNYRNENWDIEHICAVNLDDKIDSDKQKEWYDNNKTYINTINNNDLITNIKRWDNREEIKFNEDIYQKVVEYFNKLKGTEYVYGLGNLALLDSGTNRGYGNNLFPCKRKKIIDADETTKFIPVCTKNAFLGYYLKEQLIEKTLTADDANVYFWTENKAESYFKDMKGKLINFANELEDEDNNNA